MDAVIAAIKLNIQQHFERFFRESDEKCNGCPFREECFNMDTRATTLCEVITGKSHTELKKGS